MTATSRWPRSSRMWVAAIRPARWRKPTGRATTPLGMSRSMSTIGASACLPHLTRSRMVLVGHRQQQAVDATLIELAEVVGVELVVALGIRQDHRAADSSEPARRSGDGPASRAHPCADVRSERTHETDDIATPARCDLAHSSRAKLSFQCVPHPDPHFSGSGQRARRSERAVRRRTTHRAFMRRNPPSTERTSPVMKLARLSSSRNATALATSSGRPSRPRAWAASDRARSR